MTDSTSDAAGSASDSRPVLRIVSGNPTPAEIAAVTVALLSGGDSDEADAPARPVIGGWADRPSLHRAALRPGPGGWRAGTR